MKIYCRTVERVFFTPSFFPRFSENEVLFSWFLFYLLFIISNILFSGRFICAILWKSRKTGKYNECEKYPFYSKIFNAVLRLKLPQDYYSILLLLNCSLLKCAVIIWYVWVRSSTILIWAYYFRVKCTGLKLGIKSKTWWFYWDNTYLKVFAWNRYLLCLSL